MSSALLGRPVDLNTPAFQPPFPRSSNQRGRCDGGPAHDQVSLHHMLDHTARRWKWPAVGDEKSLTRTGRLIFHSFVFWRSSEKRQRESETTHHRYSGIRGLDRGLRND